MAVNGTPLVAVVSTVPLLSEAVRDALDPIARVTWFPSGPDLPGLLRSLRPDAVVVDTDTAAAEAAQLAATSDLPLVHVSLDADRVRLLHHGAWTDGADDSARSIRNLLVGALYGKETVV